MGSKKKEPDKVIWAGGREFRLYRYYDASLGEELINYPDFQKNPEYTAEGRPFTLAVQEGCPHGDSGDQTDPDPGDCSGCMWFAQASPGDAIGVCMCEARGRAKEEEAK